MYFILPLPCTLFQSSKSIKFGHRPYSSYEKNMYLITMYSIPLYLITAPQKKIQKWSKSKRKKKRRNKTPKMKQIQKMEQKLKNGTIPTNGTKIKKKWIKLKKWSKYGRDYSTRTARTARTF